MTRATNWTLATVLAALLSTAHLLDGPADHAAEQAQLVSLQDAIKTEAAEARFTRAAARICGENAGFRQLDETTVQCFTHKGKPTVKGTL